MTVEIWMGGMLKRVIRAKRIDWSFNGSFVTIFDTDGNAVETSSNNIIIIHDKKEGASDA